MDLKAGSAGFAAANGELNRHIFTYITNIHPDEFPSKNKALKSKKTHQTPCYGFFEASACLHW